MFECSSLLFFHQFYYYYHLVLIVIVSVFSVLAWVFFLSANLSFVCKRSTGFSSVFISFSFCFHWASTQHTWCVPLYLCHLINPIVVLQFVSLFNWALTTYSIGHCQFTAIHIHNSFSVALFCWCYFYYYYYCCGCYCCCWIMILYQRRGRKDRVAKTAIEMKDRNNKDT